MFKEAEKLRARQARFRSPSNEIENGGALISLVC